MTDDKFYTSLSANNIMAKLTNHVQRTRLITPSTDKCYSLDSEDDFCSGCRNISHQQQFFSELLSAGRSHNTNFFYFRREVFLFAVRFFYFPRGYSFCREAISFAVTVVGHCSNKCLRLDSEKFVLASESNLSLATGLAS